MTASRSESARTAGGCGDGRGLAKVQTNTARGEQLAERDVAQLLRGARVALLVGDGVSFPAVPTVVAVADATVGAGVLARLTPTASPTFDAGQCLELLPFEVRLPCGGDDLTTGVLAQERNQTRRSPATSGMRHGSLPKKEL